MKDYSSEEKFLEDNAKRILYADENELGSQYIVCKNGIFYKYSFKGGSCRGCNNISFNEFFEYYSKGMKLPLSICKILRLEVLLLLLIGFIINIGGISISRAVQSVFFNSNSIIGILFIIMISFCLVEIVFNSRSYIAELCRKALEIVLVIKLGELVILSFGGTNIIKGIVFILVGFYIIASAVVVNIKVSLDSMYKDLELKFSK